MPLSLHAITWGEAFRNAGLSCRDVAERLACSLDVVRNLSLHQVPAISYEGGLAAATRALGDRYGISHHLLDRLLKELRRRLQIKPRTTTDAEVST